MRVASIDIGTNTLRLLIADVKGGAMTPLLYKRAIARLGGGYRAEIGIATESARRALDVLSGFANLIREHRVELILPVATSVVRNARNRDSFVREASAILGASLRVVSGEAEAKLSLLGVTSVLDPAGGRMIVMDIGGGSTEYIFVSGSGDGFEALSMEMGVVHLTEGRLKSDPPTTGELASLTGDIDAVLVDLKKKASVRGVDASLYSSKAGARLVGTAGTVTTLAAIVLGLEDYDPKKIDNAVLSRDAIEAIYKRLCSMTIEERGKVLSLEKGREDLIVSGAAIALRTMHAFGFEMLSVSDAGLLEGIIMEGL